MKIVLFAGSLRTLPTTGYGAEQATWDLARALRAAQHDVTLVAPGGSTCGGVNVVACPASDSEVLDDYGQTWNEREAQWAARSIRKFSGADVIHDLSCSTALHEIACTTFGCKKPHLYTTNGISWKSPMIARHNVVVVSARAQEMAAVGGHTWDGTKVETGPRDPALPTTRVVRYGCDLGFYRPSKTQDGTILYVGRPHEHKGTELIPRIARLRPDLQFVCAWRADTKDHFRAEAAFKRDAAGIDNLKLVELPEGPAHHEVKRDLLARAAVLLHPAVYTDSGPRTVVEAQACGTPVASFRRGGVPESTCDGETGALVELPPEWPEEEAKRLAVERLSGAIDRALGLNREVVRDWADAELSIERMAADYVRLYEELMAGGRW